MLNLLLAHAALGAVLGLGSRVTVLFLPTLAALIEGTFVAHVVGYSPAVGCAVVFAIVTSVQVGYMVGSMAMVSRPDIIGA